MQIFVGTRDVTSQFNTFFGQEGVSLDGNFRGETETQAYTQALNYLEGQVRSAATTDEERAEISERFAAYRGLLSSGCEASTRATAYIYLTQGMYEELTSFIESDAFESVQPPARQAQLVALQSEVFSRLHQAGAPRAEEINAAGGAGTSAETPMAPFQPHMPIIETVDLAIDSGLVPFDQCAATVDYEGSLPIFFDPVGQVSSVQPQPFTGRVVNTDFRYSTHERPASAVVEQAPAAAPIVNTELDGILADDGPGVDDLF